MMTIRINNTDNKTLHFYHPWLERILPNISVHIAFLMGFSPFHTLLDLFHRLTFSRTQSATAFSNSENFKLLCSQPSDLAINFAVLQSPSRLALPEPHDFDATLHWSAEQDYQLLAVCLFLSLLKNKCKVPTSLGN